MDRSAADATTPQHDSEAMVSPSTTLGGDHIPPHLAKVYARHGRIDLDPMPSDDPADPLNWSSWKKHSMLCQVAFHALMGPFQVSRHSHAILSHVLTLTGLAMYKAAAVIPAFFVRTGSSHR